jgi:hypothetical protein
MPGSAKTADVNKISTVADLSLLVIIILLSLGWSIVPPSGPQGKIQP